MIRSYALTLSALTLRIMQFSLATWTTVNPEDGYQLVAWPSWLLNWAVAEWIINRTRS